VLTKGFALPILIVIFVSLFVIAGTGFYFFKLNNNKTTSSNQITQPTFIPTPLQAMKSPVIVKPITSPSPVPPLDITFIKSGKRLYKQTDKIAGNQNYPNELLMVSDNNLQDIKCSPKYGSTEDGNFTYSDNNQQYKFSNTKLSQMITSALTTVSIPGNGYSDIPSFNYCLTSNNQAYLEYEVWGGGGGGLNVAYFGKVNSDNTVTKFANIPNDGAAYFGCSGFLQITIDGKLYTQCGGGDGCCGSMSIYKIDSTTGDILRLIKCGNGSDPKDITIVKCS